MATITKKELVNRIAAKTKQTKIVTKEVIQMFLDEIVSELGQGNRLEFREFGVFEIKTRAARKARNPRTGVRVDVPSKAVVHFKAGRAMKEMVQRAIVEAEGDHGQADAPSAAADAPSAAGDAAPSGGAGSAPSSEAAVEI